MHAFDYLITSLHIPCLTRMIKQQIEGEWGEGTNVAIHRVYWLYIQLHQLSEAKVIAFVAIACTFFVFDWGILIIIVELCLCCERTVRMQLYVVCVCACTNVSVCTPILRRRR